MTLLPVFSIAPTGTTLNHPGTSRATCSNQGMPACEKEPPLLCLNSAYSTHWATNKAFLSLQTASLRHESSFETGRSCSYQVATPVWKCRF